MASAAAVAADAARSPIENDIGEDEGRPGEITSGIYPRDEDVPGVNGNVEEEDDDDDEELPSNPLRGHKTKRPVDDDDGDAEDNLFGDEEGTAEEPAKPARRQLDDEELDSGDDQDRMDRIGDEEPEQEYETQEKVTMDLEIARQAIPEPSDGEMYLLKMPTFMAIDPQAWDHTTFQPPTTDHHSKAAPSQTFSAYNTALSTIRWRRSPSDRSQLQSNARINRWSDGSLTLQLASDPTTQYEVDGNPLAPPQRNPIKPTPTSIRAGQKGGRHGAALEEKYSQTKDAYTYLIRPLVETGSMVVTQKITAGLSIKPSSATEDDAIERLQASLAAASNASKVNGASGISLIQIDEDPEKAKLEALAAVRESEKTDRRRRAAIEREAARSNRVLGNRGLNSNRYNGLNVGMLEEDDEEGGGGRARPSPNKARNRQRRRRNSEYSDDEDFGRKRFSREDEYDEEDDFVAPSDEEEVVEDDEDPDDGIVEDYRQERTPKRDREEDDEADAPGEEVDEDDVAEKIAHEARIKRRRVVDDEDEE